MKVLFIQLGRIGDMILCTPAIHAIKEKYPDAEIDVLAGRHNTSIIENDPAISKVITYNKEPHKFAKTLFDVRKSKYDYLIDPKDHHSTESSLIARIARADIKIGLNTDNSNVYDLSIPYEADNKSLHYVEKCFRPLNELGIGMPVDIPLPVLYSVPESDEYVKKFIGLESRQKAVFNISASSERKMWHDELWIELFNSIYTNDMAIYLIYIPGHKDHADKILKACPFIQEFHSRSIADAVSLVKYSDFVITPDTSFVHISAAFDKPLLALYSGIDDFFVKFKPLNSRSAIIRADKGDPGIRSIKPEEVQDAWKKLLR